MLYERGPLDLFVDAAIPAPGLRDTFDGLTASEVVALDAGAGALVAAGLTFASAAAAVDDGAALDVADAAAELNRQPGDVSPELAAAAAGVEILDGDLAGLTNEISDDLRQPVPPAPTIPPAPDDPYHAGNPDPEHGPPPPAPITYDDGPPVARLGGGCFGPECAARYREALARQVLAWSGRAATDADLLAVDRYMGTYGYLDDNALTWLWANWVQPNL